MSRTAPDFTDSIRIEPALCRPGEPVRIHLATTQEYPPYTLEMTVRFLEEEFSVGEGVHIEWDGSGPVKKGRVVIIPEQTGNYRIRAGGMIRTFGVADKTCVIGSVFLPLASTGYPVGNQLDYYHPDLHNAPLPADYVVMLSDDRSLSPDWDVHRALRALQRVYGDGVLPFFTQEISCVIRDESASQNREEFDTALLTGILNRWRKIGYESNDVPGIADGCRFPIHSLQASGISGLIETGVDDHDDEERKNTPESGSPVIVLSWDISGRDGRQLRLSPRCYHSKGLIAPGNLSGFLDDLDRLLERRVPYIPVVLDGDAFDVVAINREIIAALLERPRRHNLVFSRSSDVVRYFNRHRD